MIVLWLCRCVLALIDVSVYVLMPALFVSVLVCVCARCRTERVRRWDHLRKTHNLTTCDKCNVRLPKDDAVTHEIACTGDRAKWLAAHTPPGTVPVCVC